MFELLPLQGIGSFGLFIQLLNGIMFGFILFLVASGISISLGVMGILNVAHGALYALGAFVSFSVFTTLLQQFTPNAAVEWILLLIGGALISATVIALFSVVLEVLFYRRVYERNLLYQIIMTFGILLILRDLMRFFWGRQSQTFSDLYQGINSINSTELIGFWYPTFNLVLIVTGTILAIGLFWFFEESKTGLIIRSIALDREMATAIGIDTKRNFMLVFALSAFLAGFAGAMIMPQAGATIGMGDTPLVLSFVIVVIGGMGSLYGSLAGALAVGIFSRMAIVFSPTLEFVAPYLLMIIILLYRPEGLFSSWSEPA